MTLRQLVAWGRSPASSSAEVAIRCSPSEPEATIDSECQTVDDFALIALKQQLQASKEEGNKVDGHLTEVLKRKDKLREDFELLSCELGAARQKAPALGQKIRAQEVRNKKQAKRVNEMLSEFHGLDKALRDNSTRKQEMDAQRVKESHLAKALQAELDACKQEVQSGQEWSLELQNIREEIMTCKAEIDAEKQATEQLQEESRQARLAKQGQRAVGQKEGEGVRTVGGAPPKVL